MKDAQQPDYVSLNALPGHLREYVAVGDDEETVWTWTSGLATGQLA